MRDSDRWSASVASLPMTGRADRERPFWRSLASSLGWRRVADAGCGSGFHVSLLREIGVEAVGFDVAVGVVRRGAGTIVGDLGKPPLRPATFDAALCLGNTISILASRGEQLRALVALADLVRPGGIVLVQGEDVGALVARGAVARTRALEDGALHVRVFERRGRRVQMVAGIARAGAESLFERTLMLPTSRRALLRKARALRLNPVELPSTPPGGPTTWWAALSVPSP